MSPKPEMLPKSGPEGIAVRPEVLQARFESKGWSLYRLAQEVADVRNKYWGEKTDAKKIYTSVTNALQNPDNAKAKQVEAIIIALGGSLDINWETEVTYIETSTQGFSMNARDNPEDATDPDSD